MTQTDSSFTIGELDSSLTNDPSQFVFTPVFASIPDKYDFLKILIQEITVNSQVLPSPPSLSRSLICGAASLIDVLETKTTLILGPLHTRDVSWAEGQIWRLASQGCVLKERLRHTPGYIELQLPHLPRNVLVFSYGNEGHCCDLCEVAKGGSDAVQYGTILHRQSNTTVSPRQAVTDRPSRMIRQCQARQDGLPGHNDEPLPAQILDKAG
ncbi:hypothetical protein DEU56DRAFT_753113 [Suillus clintonianus]|uniref:uncharacterized protein n=1 Tax=Suillus clintonianus TaxID=1904413 RepID=UPI001B863690|nr:uncharacterized protein DEU56DRAFT_753113 [Suillus clintonianus]KAG2148880.1 hypothetical protein DEU56DRAFT_753113 [Suillus clintonianus]